MRPLPNVNRETLEDLFLVKWLSKLDIQKALGIGETTLNRLLDHHGLKRLPNRSMFIPEEDDILRRCWVAGIDTVDIAKLLPRHTLSGIRTRAAALGLRRTQEYMMDIRRRAVAAATASAAAMVPVDLLPTETVEDFLARPGRFDHSDYAARAQRSGRPLSSADLPFVASATGCSAFMTAEGVAGTSRPSSQRHRGA